MKNILTLLLVCTFAASGLGQSQKNRADRFFDKGDYKGAAKYYTAALENNNSKEILGRLIDSYYLDQDYVNAAIYLKQMVGQRFIDADKNYDNAYNFKMYQILNASNSTDRSLDYLSMYYKNMGASFDKDEALAQLELLKNRDAAFTLERSNISSEADDFGPVKVGDSIFFVSDRLGDNVLNTLFGKRFKSTNRPFVDIYGVRVNEKNQFAGEAVKLGQGVNSALHDGNFCFNTAGTEMYLSRSAYEDGDRGKIFDETNTNRVQLYKSVRIDGVWREAERLPFVQEKYSYMHPTLTRDGKRLYFSSDMDGGLGGFDLYYVTIQLDGSYGTPVNLGPTVNTAHTDQFPYVADSGDLYFSTDGRLGLGFMDVFVAPLTVKGFTKPINLGAPINSNYDDFSMSYYSNKKGLFATNRNGSNDDIYSFVQNKEIIKRSFETIFEFRDSQTNELITDAKIQILGYQGKEVYTATNAKASFKTDLAIDDYILKGSGENYAEDQMKVEVLGENGDPIVLKLNRIYTDDELKAIKEKNLPKDLKFKDPSRFELLTDQQAPQVVERDGALFIDVPPIYFDFDLYNIREDSRAVLDGLAAKLIKYPRIQLNIRSHTDSRGEENYNVPLSERRAQSTFNYLVAKGVNVSRVTYKGYGSSKPVVACPAGQCTEADHQVNRRSEFEITGY